MSRYRRFLYIIIVLAPLLLLMIFSGDISNKSYYSLIITAYIIFLLFMAYMYFEKSKKGVQEIAVIATLSSISAIGRVIFAPIPNVQPSTFIILISGLVFGWYDGFLIGATTAFVSNIFLGQGPWTPWQMIAWGIIGIIGGLMKRKNKKPKIEYFTIISFVCGILFGFIMNMWHVIGFLKDISKEAILLTYLNSVYYDVLHGVGNVIFSLVFYESFYKILNRFYARTYFKEDNVKER